MCRLCQCRQAAPSLTGSWGTVELVAISSGEAKFREAQAEVVKQKVLYIDL